MGVLRCFEALDFGVGFCVLLFKASVCWFRVQFSCSRDEV